MAERDLEVRTRLTAQNLTKGAMGQVNTSLVLMQNNIRKVNAVGTKLIGVGRAMKSAGRSMIFAGGAIAGSLAFAVKGAVDYEKRFGRISTLLDETAGEAMAKFGAGIDKISIETGGKLKDLQDAFFEAKSGGVALADVTGFVELAQKGAVGGFTDAVTVTKALTKVQNAYGLDLKGVTRVLDQFFIANDVGQTTIGELGRTIGGVSATMALFGVTTADMLATVAVGTTILGSTEETVTSLNGLMVSIRRPTEDAIKEITRLNKNLKATEQIQFSVGEVKRRGFLGFLSNVIKGTKGSTESLEKLFGANVRGFKLLAGIVGNQEKVAETSARMAKVTDKGALATQNFNKQLATMDLKLKIVFAKMSIFRKEIGFKLFPVLEELLPKFSKILKDTADWVAENKKLVTSFLTMGAKAVPILIGVGSISWALGGIIGIFGNITKAIGGVGTALTFLAAHPAFTAILAIGGIIALIVAKQKQLQAQTGTPESRKAFAENLFGQRKKMEAKLFDERVANRQKELKKNEATLKGIFDRNRAEIAGGPTKTDPVLQKLLEGSKKTGGGGPVFALGASVPGGNIPAGGFKSEAEARASLMKQLEGSDSIVLGNFDEVGKKIVKKATEIQEKLTGIAKDGANKRKNLGAEVAPIDIFERGRGQNLTEEILNRAQPGQGREALGAFASRGGGGGRNFNIGTIEMPNASDRETMADELERMSIGTGLVGA